jgi:hypothetical protein
MVLQWCYNTVIRVPQCTHDAANLLAAHFSQLCDLSSQLNSLCNLASALCNALLSLSPSLRAHLTHTHSYRQQGRPGGRRSACLSLRRANVILPPPHPPFTSQPPLFLPHTTPHHHYHPALFHPAFLLSRSVIRTRTPKHAYTRSHTHTHTLAVFVYSGGP